MKNIFKYLALAVLGLLLVTGCNTERADTSDASFTVENADSLYAGTAVNFVFDGLGDFVTIYSGKEGQVWGEPGATGSAMSEETIGITYSVLGEYTVTVVASSYGNWSEEEIVDVKSQVITVKDNRAEFAKFSIGKPRQDGVITGNDITF